MHAPDVGAPHLGSVVIPVAEVVSEQKTEGWFDLQGPTVTKKNGQPIPAEVCHASQYCTCPLQLKLFDLGSNCILKTHVLYHTLLFFGL